MRLKIREDLITARLNPKFTGYYKTVYSIVLLSLLQQYTAKKNFLLIFLIIKAS